MMVSSLGMGVCMAVVAGGSSQPSSTASVAVAAAFIFLFSLFFPTGFLGLTFLYAAEISPLSHRVPITAMSTGMFIHGELDENCANSDQRPLGSSTL